MNEDSGAFDNPAYIDIIREYFFPMEPETPPALPEPFARRLYPSGVQEVPGIGTVIFDVYGTLFISSAGDIGTGSAPSGRSLDAFAAAYTDGSSGEELRHYFREEVLKAHLRLFPVTPYPEIRVEKIWEPFPRRRRNISPGEFALRYELAVNPVFPAPGALETLVSLKSMGITLGIISNAQFFTPLLFRAYFGASLEELGFTRELLVFSYEEGQAKPSPLLFSKAKGYIAKNSGKADTCLYIGNDMLNDIYGAQDAGFRTALFAGDARSLRLREGNRLTEKVLPQAVIMHLSDIVSLIRGGSHVSP